MLYFNKNPYIFHIKSFIFVKLLFERMQDNDSKVYNLLYKFITIYHKYQRITNLIITSHTISRDVTILVKILHNKIMHVDLIEKNKLTSYS